jgi:hypothetical protein
MQHDTVLPETMVILVKGKGGSRRVGQGTAGLVSLVGVLRQRAYNPSSISGGRSERDLLGRGNAGIVR